MVDGTVYPGQGENRMILRKIRARRRSFLDGLSSRFREEKLRPVVDSLKAGATVLDIGVWCQMPEPHPAENWLEKQGIGAGRLIAVGLEDMQEFHQKYPQVFCVQANGSALPFGNRVVDIAIANAVLEHVASKDQVVFAQEMARVVRRLVLIAVPDRWCPLEIHSRILLLHWLPCWRIVFRMIGQAYWASEKNLSTLFTHASLSSLLKKTVANPDGWRVERQKLWGIPVSLIARFRAPED